MPDRRPLPDTVRSLLARLESIAQLEVLLLLARTAPREWDAERLAAELRIERAWAQEQLATLRQRDLLVESEAGAGLYRFEPSSPALAKSVEALAASYADRRVSVVAALYAEPGERIREFAEAFRIRREDEDG
jgi:hypothetical protein